MQGLTVSDHEAPLFVLEFRVCRPGSRASALFRRTVLSKCRYTRGAHNCLRLLGGPGTPQEFSSGPSWKAGLPRRVPARGVLAVCFRQTLHAHTHTPCNTRLLQLPHMGGRAIARTSRHPVGNARENSECGAGLAQAEPQPFLFLFYFFYVVTAVLGKCKLADRPSGPCRIITNRI